MAEKCTYIDVLSSYTGIIPCDKDADVMITTFGVKKLRCRCHAEAEKNILWRIEKSLEYQIECVG